MNSVMHPSKTTSLRYNPEEEFQTKVSVHQVRPQVANKETANQQYLVSKKILNRLLPVLTVSGLVAVLALYFGSDDVINREAYKAIAVILLLLQVKQLTHSTKKQ